LFLISFLLDRIDPDGAFVDPKLRSAAGEASKR
jgi:hypothetical protein